MTLIAQDVILDVRGTLNDNQTVKRWSDDDLCKYLMGAIRQIGVVRPDVLSKPSTVQLIAGTRQALPADGFMLFRVIRNMGASGNTPGTPIKKNEILDLDMFQSDWHSQTPVAAIDDYMYDDRDPRAWWCNPPSDGTGQVQLIYGYEPTEITSVDMNVPVPLDDVHEGPLKMWMLHLAFQRELSSLKSMQLSTQYATWFFQSYGLQPKAFVMASPNTPQPNLGIAS